MATDSKSELAQYLQRAIGRTLKKDDVVYTTEAAGELFQSTVKLVCKQGEEYAGAPCTSRKEAMQAAAAQVLQDFSAEIAALPPKSPKAKNKTPATDEPPPMSKTQLAQKLQEHCKRPMTKDDVVYSTVKTGDGFQATVRLACTGGQEFAGEVTTGEKGAQHAAAQQALENSHMWKAGVVAQKGVAALVGKSAKGPAGASLKRKAPEPTGANPKSALAEFLMKHFKRAMTKGDIVYSAAETVGGGFQATVELVCHENKAFAGEVRETSKLADASAAEQALLAVTAELGEPAPKQKKQKTTA
mmetsp:Transcript_56978/g.152529  ORF Transcript_56978/g.152529 Transcript_56978/m.152529 type:complete len:301 (-) Transcript_56978:193-1095(-)